MPPFILWQVLIRYINLSNQQRIHLLTISLLIFKYEYDNFIGKNKEKHFYENDVKNCEILSCFTKVDLLKFKNTLIVDIYSIKTYPNFIIATQRVGTSCEEKTFGKCKKKHE